MTNEQFRSLRRGNVIREGCSGTAYVVDAHYGDFVIAMKSMHVSNPSEWELCASENSGAVALDDVRAIVFGRGDSVTKMKKVQDLNYVTDRNLSDDFWSIRGGGWSNGISNFIFCITYSF
jgi:hypothetical protein